MIGDAVIAIVTSLLVMILIAFALDDLLCGNNRTALHMLILAALIGIIGFVAWFFN